MHSNAAEKSDTPPSTPVVLSSLEDEPMNRAESIRKEKVRATPQESVSPEEIAKLLREAGSEVQPPAVKHFQFVVILAEDSNPHDAPAMISKILGTLVQHRANVSPNISTLFVALLGVPFAETNSAESRLVLVDALLRANGDRIKIAHGECDGVFGMFGCDKRLTYGGVIPGFSGILNKLLESEPGTAVEIA
jgi:hypothetical protein